MFPSPQKTLTHSLFNVLTDAQQRHGDVCFAFGNEQQLWAHRALLIARVPEECIVKLMPQLLDGKNTNNALVTITDLSTWIPYSVFVNLLRFWYTADFLSPETQSSSPTPSIVSSLVSSSTTTSSLSSPTDRVSPLVPCCTESISVVQQTIKALEQQLQLKLLPQTTTGLTHTDQLVADLACMRRNQLSCDITVNIFMPKSTSTKASTIKKKEKPAPKPAPTLVKRHTTPAVIITSASTKPDTIISILNTTSAAKEDDKNDETEAPPSPPSATMVSFPVHCCILASRSSYFHSLLYDQPDSTSSSLSTVLLPSDLFSSLTLDIILHYLYTDQLQIPDLPPSSSTMAVFQKEMNRKKYRLRQLQKLFSAADYLGLADSFCKVALHEIESICHRFRCTCSSCVLLLPSVVAFANKQPQLALLRSTLMNVYTDPIQAFPTLWSQKPFSLLVMAHLVPNDEDNIKSSTGSILLPSSLQSLFNTNNNNCSSSDCDIQTPTSSNPSYPPPGTVAANGIASALLVDLISLTLENITKRNAIHVLHSLHMCLSKIRSADPLPTWSQSSLSLIHAFLHHTLAMVILDFNYYCVDYPILLSCVDGIGGGFSVDFLDFLLKRLLNDGIQDANAAVLYQGIVRDLIGRQEVVKNVAVDGVLLDARRQCIDYLMHRWIGVKAQDGFQSIDKDVLRLLAEDINVPYRTLSKPMESEFSTIFGFKAKSFSTGRQPRNLALTESIEATAITADSGFKNAATSGTGVTLDHSKSRRRLSLNTLRRPTPKSNVHRRSTVEAGESIKNQCSLPENDDNLVPATQHSFYRHLSLQQSQQQQATHLTMTHGSPSTSLTDMLLPVDATISDVSPPTTTSSPNYKHHRGSNRDGGDVTVIATTTSSRLTGKTARKSMLTFELPETPIRTKLSIKTNTTGGGHRASTKHKYRWGGRKTVSSKESGSDSGDDDDDHQQMAVAAVGAKVELLRRPLPTLGRIKYIGHVQFSKGTWVGVELESRLGQNDGSVDGIRYFQTDAQRGVFVRSDGIKLISGPLKP